MCLTHLCMLGFSPAWMYTGLVHVVTTVVSSYVQFICEFICVVSSYVLRPEDVLLQSSPDAALTSLPLYFHNDP